MIQRKAISFIEPVWRALKNFEGEKLLKVQGLVNYLTDFDIISDVDLRGRQGNYHPRLAVIHNIITRGLPIFSAIYQDIPTEV